MAKRRTVETFEGPIVADVTVANAKHGIRFQVEVGTFKLTFTAARESAEKLLAALEETLKQ